MQNAPEALPRVGRRPAPATVAEMDALLALNEPVILEGNLFGAASREELCVRLGDAPLPVRFFQEGGKPFTFTTKELPLSDLCTALEQESRSGGGRHYLAGPNLLLHADPRVAGWARAQTERLPIERVQEVGLWCGRDGQHSQLHFDVTHNVLHVVAGRKTVVLASPRDYRCLYTYTSADLDPADASLRRMYRFSRCNVRQPDYKQFPLLERCQLQVAEVNAGEALLIPLAYFHDVVSEGSEQSVLSIAINVFWKPTTAETQRLKWLRVFLDDEDE